MGGMQAGLSYYKTYFFEAPVTGSYTCTVSGASVTVYDQIFMTNNPNVNLYMLPAGGNTFVLNVAAPSTFIFVLTTPQNSSISYTGTIVGPSGALVNELPAPAFNPQPTPTNQFLWLNQDPVPIIGNSLPADASWSWWRGVNGLSVDGTTAIAGLNTRTNDQTASVTAVPTNLWFWARIDGSYGYDDSD